MSITIQQAIRALHLPGDHLKSYDEYGIYIDDELKEAMQLAMAALREKAEREDPKPLTLEELRQQEGCPVFLVIENIDVQRWAILDLSGDERTCFQNGLRLSNEVYGITWLAYRHKPKEVDDKCSK